MLTPCAVRNMPAKLQNSATYLSEQYHTIKKKSRLMLSSQKGREYVLLIIADVYKSGSSFIKFRRTEFENDEKKEIICISAIVLSAHKNWFCSQSL